MPATAKRAQKGDIPIRSFTKPRAFGFTLQFYQTRRVATTVWRANFDDPAQRVWYHVELKDVRIVFKT